MNKKESSAKELAAQNKKKKLTIRNSIRRLMKREIELEKKIQAKLLKEKDLVLKKELELM